jgi:hypothetical protein
MSVDQYSFSGEAPHSFFSSKNCARQKLRIVAPTPEIKNVKPRFAQSLSRASPLAPTFVATPSLNSET